MIYAGFIHFNEATDRVHELKSALELYTQTSATIVCKNSLTLCYGKISNEKDVDEVWENSSSFLFGRIFDKERGGSFEKEAFKKLAFFTKEETLSKLWGKYVYIHANEKASQFEVVIDSTGPACCLKITKNERTTKPFWNPLSSYKTPISEEKNAVSILQETLKSWVEPYKNICVSLSGGLDSSSLVYCLKNIKKENQTLSALNYFHGLVKSSNELSHARNVCEETGIKLIEVDVSSSLPFDPYSQKQHFNPNKPFPGLISLKLIETISDHLPNSGSCAFLSGHGSDHIFMCPPSKRSLSDYVIEKGFKGSKNQVKNITQFYRDPLFAILKKNAISLISHFFSQRLEKRHPKNRHDETPEWFKQSLQQKILPDFLHPVYETLSKTILPGKYEQIDALYEALASIHVEMNQINPTSYPFLYEPVVEFALSLSTYDLFNNGYDRYPLRKAISDHFKTETVWRRDKGQTTGVFQLGVKKNLESILNICLEGKFVKQGIIDKEGLHKTIVLIANGDTKHLWPFRQLASAEIFLNYWE